MARMKDPSSIADKQITRLSGATGEIEAGIASVDKSPTAAAADNLDKAKANYIHAIDSGKTAKNLRAVTLDEWKTKTTAKVGRIAEGIEAARSRIVSFHRQRNAFQATIDSKLASIPKRTLADSIRRMTEQVSSMAKFEFDRTK